MAIQEETIQKLLTVESLRAWAQGKPPHEPVGEAGSAWNSPLARYLNEVAPPEDKDDIWLSSGDDVSIDGKNGSIELPDVLKIVEYLIGDRWGQDITARDLLNILDEAEAP